MSSMPPVTRRTFIQSTGIASLSTLLPEWVYGMTASGPLQLAIEPTNIRINGKAAVATGVNGTVPGPLIRLREGERAFLDVTNNLEEDSSIHWHGLILPSDMDGVPGLSFAGIKPGHTWHYAFDVVQNGTYWYHSHSGLQEQTGVYGPLIIDPAGDDPVEYDVEYVVMLSDWTFEDPWRLFAKLKKGEEYYNRNRRTLADFMNDVRENGFGRAAANSRMWGNMRMSSTDIADVTGATYTFLLNGHDPDANWTAIYEPGQRVRLRIINGSAMTFFNFRIPGLELKVVQADGLNVSPVLTDELQIGVAETYDVVVTPKQVGAFTIFAEAMDRSGYARGTLTSSADIAADVPALREPPLLTMADMGMDHAAMDHAGHDMASMAIEHNHPLGPGVANVTMMPTSRLDHPGIGLEDEPHRVLTYAQLKSLDENIDARAPTRTLELHLTGNMERYMWSFDGVKYEHVDGPIVFEYNERIRMVLVNDTMMSHPIHLHGMFVELDNGNGTFNPRLHTVVVKPGERLAVNLTADQPGRWAFHCHMIYHMKGGMMREVRVLAPGESLT